MFQVPLAVCSVEVLVEAIVAIMNTVFFFLEVAGNCPLVRFILRKLYVQGKVKITIIS
jgi:hypothetical protein